MSGQDEDLSLKVLQLECIIDSKNRELQLLREHLSEDQEDTIQQLQEENRSLKEQLSKHTTPSSADQRAPHAAAVSITSDLKRAATDVANKVLQSSEAVDYLMYALQQAEKAAATADAGPAQVNGHIAKSSVDRLVQLNVSGKHMVVPLSVLQQVPGSRLSSMFTAGSSEQQQQLLRDADGRYYLPYEYEAFSSILSVLQARSVFGSSSSSSSSSGDSYYLRPPHAYGQQQQLQQQQAAAAAGEPLSSSWNYVTDLVNHLGIQSLLNPVNRTTAAATNGSSSSSSSASSDGSLTHEPLRSFDPALAVAPKATAAASSSNGTGNLSGQQQPGGSGAGSAGLRRSNSAAAAAARKGSGRVNPTDITEDTNPTLRHFLPSDDAVAESLTAPPAAAAAAAVTAALFALPAKHPTAASSDGSSKLAAAAAAEPAAAAADPAAFAAVQQALQPRQSWSGSGSDDSAAAAAELAAARQY